MYLSIICHDAAATSASVVWPAPWSSNIIFDFPRNFSGGVVVSCAMVRSATQPSTPFVVTSNETEKSASTVLRITGTHATTNPEASTDDPAQTTVLTCPDLTPSWGAGEDTLYIAGLGHDHGSRTIVSYPLPDNQIYNSPGTGFDGASLGLCSTDSNLGTLSPGDFEISDSEAAVMFTIAVRAEEVATDIVIEELSKQVYYPYS